MKCTQCEKDKHITVTNVKVGGVLIIKANERLCLFCASIRGYIPSPSINFEIVKQDYWEIYENSISKTNERRGPDRTESG